MTRDEFTQFVRDMYEEGYRAGANDFSPATDRATHTPQQVAASQELHARVGHAISILAEKTAARYWDTHNNSTERN